MEIDRYTPHDMALYLDGAMKKYLPLRRQVLNEGLIPAEEPIAGKPRLYVAPVKNSLPKDLQKEFPVMMDGLLEQYDDILPGFVLDQGTGNATASELLKKAAEAGCDLLAVTEIHGEKMQNNQFYIALNQTIYRVSDGSTVSLGGYSSNTKVMTPLLAFMNDSYTMFKDSPQWAGAK